MFGSLSALSIKTEVERFPVDYQGADLSSPDRAVIDKPVIMKDITTGCEGLRGVSLFSDDEIWTCGNDNIMRLFNLQEELVNSVKLSQGTIHEI